MTITTAQELSAALREQKEHLRVVRWYEAAKGRHAWVSLYADDTATAALNAQGIATRALSDEYPKATPYDFTGYRNIVIPASIERIVGSADKMNALITGLGLQPMPKDRTRLAETRGRSARG